MPTTDLSDPGLFRSGSTDEVFLRLRRDRPLYWNKSHWGAGFWSLTRHADVSSALLDHEWLSSREGSIMGSSYRAGNDSASGAMLVASDVPRHRNLRRIFLQALGTPVVEAIQRKLGILLDRELGRILDEGGGDLARSASRQLPVAALTVLLGLGESDAAHLVDLTDAVVGYLDETHSDPGLDDQTRLALGHLELIDFLGRIVDERRRRPGDDAPSRFIAAEKEGVLTPDGVLYNLLNLVFGGNETSAHTASAGMWLLMQNPGSYDWLAERPDRIDPALTEILRLTSAAAYVRRIAKRDRTLHGMTIREGDPVLLWLYSGNRDEEVYDQPDELRLNRDSSRHLALGLGIHRCVGATPALAELRNFFHAVLSMKGTRMKPSGPPVLLRSNFIRGINSLRVEVA